MKIFKLDLEKAEEPETKLPTSVGSAIEKASKFQKNIYFCFIDYAKTFGCVDHHKLWKILKEMGIPDHLTCLPRLQASIVVAHGLSGFSWRALEHRLSSCGSWG